jgi:SAM-dependent methyltransferase
MHIEVMAGIYSRYWPADTPAHVIQTEIIRHASQLELIRVPHGGRVIDVGCGWGAFAAGCASLGYRVTMVDDHGDAGFADAADLRHRIPADFDISAVRFNAVRDPWPFPADSLDAVTTFDSMEHWHDSPKRLFGDIARSLKPGGWLVIGVPNAANLKNASTP